MQLQEQPQLSSDLDVLRARLAKLVLITMTLASVFITVASSTHFSLQLVGVVDQSAAAGVLGGAGTVSGALSLRYLYLKILPVRLEFPP